MQGTPAPRYFLLEFDHPNIPLGLVVREGDIEVGAEPEDLGLILFEPSEEVVGIPFISSPFGNGELA